MAWVVWQIPCSVQAYLSSWGPWIWLPLLVTLLGLIQHSLLLGQSWCAWPAALVLSKQNQAIAIAAVPAAA